VNAWLEQLYRLKEIWITGQIVEWGYWSYFMLAVLVAFEGPFATLLGAAAASAGVMRPSLVFFAASCGNLAADTLWYFMGYLGKVEWLFGIGKRLGVNQDQLASLQHNMRKHAVKLLFFAKLSMSLMIPSLVAAGLLRISWKRWFPAVFGGEVIWTGALVLIGFYATEAIKQVEQGLEIFVLAGTIAFFVFLIIMSRRVLSASKKE